MDAIQAYNCNIIGCFTADAVLLDADWFILASCPASGWAGASHGQKTEAEEALSQPWAKADFTLLKVVFLLFPSFREM